MFNILAAYVINKGTFLSTCWTVAFKHRLVRWVANYLSHTTSQTRTVWDVYTPGWTIQSFSAVFLGEVLQPCDHLYGPLDSLKQSKALKTTEVFTFKHPCQNGPRWGQRGFGITEFKLNWTAWKTSIIKAHRWAAGAAMKLYHVVKERLARFISKVDYLINHIRYYRRISFKMLSFRPVFRFLQLGTHFPSKNITLWVVEDLFKWHSWSQWCS